MKVKIFPAARRRLLEIWDYTETKWGTVQADEYASGLVCTMNLAASHRLPWRRVPEKTLTGAFFVRHQHHFIFFRELASGEVGIFSVLHENMNIPAQLKKDAG